MTVRLDRTIFETSRLLEYFTEQELQFQTGAKPEHWPIVIVKELIDNALDACEDARVLPEVTVNVDGDDDSGSITVSDNGPGLTTETIDRILNFWTRTSDKEAYVSPSRGAQGNALKTIMAIPYVGSTESPKRGKVTIISQGIDHRVTVETDALRQEPRINRESFKVGSSGNAVRVELDFTGIIPAPDSRDFYNLVCDFALFNPHATFRLTGDKTGTWLCRDPLWKKWTPSDPTSPWWYSVDDLVRLVTAHAVHAQDGGRDLTLRDFVSQFRGLSSSAKQKRVTDWSRQRRISDFVLDGHIDANAVRELLVALRAQSRPPRPQLLGVMGEELVRDAFESWYDVRDFKYIAVKEFDGDLPYVLEVAMGRKAEPGRFDFFGINFAPTYGDPFAGTNLRYKTSREIFASTGLHGFLAELKAQPSDPLVFMLHLAYPRPRFSDRGKSRMETAS